MAFPQVGNHDVGSGRKDTSTHTGHHCDNKRHHAKTCPNFLARYEASWGYAHQHKQEYWHARLCWRGCKCHHMWWQKHFKGTKEHFWQLHWRRCFLKVTREQNKRLMCEQNYAYLKSMPLIDLFHLGAFKPMTHHRSVSTTKLQCRVKINTKKRILDDAAVLRESRLYCKPFVAHWVGKGWMEDKKSDWKNVGSDTTGCNNYFEVPDWERRSMQRHVIHWPCQAWSTHHL